MQPTRPWTLVAAVVISGVMAWLILTATFAAMAPLPWTAVPALALLSAGEFLIGRNLRVRLSGRPGAKPVQPMSVPRVVALAKASSLAGAIFGGLALGLAGYTVTMLGKPVPRHDAIVGVVTAAAALALILAALYLERSCRAPDQPDDDDLPSRNGQLSGEP
ncbi:MAG: DUF3180 domain-containing protein [Streptosporangiaceae bacterium]